MSSLDAVMERCKDDNYCFTGKNRDMIRNLVVLPEEARVDFLSPENGQGPYHSGNGGEWNPSARAPGFQEDGGQISLRVPSMEEVAEKRVRLSSRTRLHGAN